MPYIALWWLSQRFLIFVLRVIIFRPRLSVVTRLAECLPVCFIPEQNLITTMGNDVVNDRSRNVSALCLAHHAQWILSEVCLAYLLPPAAVTTLSSRWSVRVLVFMFITIFSLCKIGTAGMAARSFGFPWHGIHLRYGIRKTLTNLVRAKKVLSALTGLCNLLRFANFLFVVIKQSFWSFRTLRIFSWVTKIKRYFFISEKHFYTNPFMTNPDRKKSGLSLFPFSVF